MHRSRLVGLAAGLLVLVGVGRALSQAPAKGLPVAPSAETIRLVQERVPIPQDVQPPPVQPPPVTPTPPAMADVPAASTPRPEPAASGSTSTVPFAGGAAGAAGGPTGPAPDLGSALRQSEAAAGVEVQQRNALSLDPRIRGYRVGQYYTTSDGAAFFPARLDLDTPVSKFDPGSIRDVRVIRGPYTALLGPAFAFLDIAAVDTPRNLDGTGIKYGGRSALGYQTNGEQWNGLQTVTAAGQYWGFRGTYNILQGNDYRDGDGTLIPASYRSNNFNFGLGFDLTDRSSVEFKGLRVQQTNLEFPGLYFDIRRIDTEAYGLRYLLRDVGSLDQVTLDVWYNATVGTGDTANTSKQLFVNSLLSQAFLEANPLAATPGFPGNSPYMFQDFSTTRFGARSIGYRLAGQWGNNRDELTLIGGTDLNAFGQGLVENISFRSLVGSPPILIVDPQTGAIRPLIQGVGGDPNSGERLNQTQTIPNATATNPGLFLEGLYPVTNRLKLRSGGRIDHVRTTSDARLITGNVDLFGAPQNVAPFGRFQLDPSIYSVDSDPARNANLTRDFTLLSGFVTSEYLLTDTTTLFLNYGYAERAPTLTELYAAGPFIGVLQQGTARLIGDPNLNKERLNQFDVGVRYDNEWLQVRANAFYAWIHDYITYDANRVSDLGLSQVVFTNTDLATLAGTEVFVQMALTEWLTPFATLSYVQGIDQTHIDRRRSAQLASSRRSNPSAREFATDTEPLPQIPPMEARAGARIHQGRKDPRWQTEFEARMVTGQNEVARSLGERTTPGFTTFNIRGFFRVNKSWVMTAGVENLGDLLYREHLDPIASTLLRANGYPAPPLYRPGTNFFFTSQVIY